MNNIVIIGAGKHANVIAESIQLTTSNKLKGYLDNVPGPLVLGTDSMIDELIVENSYFHIGLGAGLQGVREKIIKKLESSQAKIINCIHSTAFVSSSAQIGKGVSILGRVFVNTSAVVGDYSCLNTGSIVEHDCIIGKNVFIQPGAVIAGSVEIGEGSIIGMGANIREGIKIGKRVIVGGGAFVCKDVPDGGFVYGVPARNITNNKR